LPTRTVITAAYGKIGPGTVYGNRAYDCCENTVI